MVENYGTGCGMLWKTAGFNAALGPILECRDQMGSDLVDGGDNQQRAAGRQQRRVHATAALARDGR